MVSTTITRQNQKIGIITILKVNNYGAELQAFALQQKLTNLGFNAEIIDYLYYKHRDFISTKAAKPFVKLGMVKRTKEWMSPIMEQIKLFPCRFANNKRKARFADFHKSYTKISKSTYKSVDELYSAPLDYDVFMVGSDQVWNPHTNVSLKPYFLTFVPDGKRKVSYASSFGVSTIPEEAQNIYKKCLNNLDRIAVREKQGVKLVEEIAGRKAQHVLDPTLLLDQNEWQEIAILPDCSKPYVLLYALSDSAYTTALSKKIANDLGWDLVRICKNAAVQDSDPSIKNIVDAGPSEFIGLFLKASFVITNSFHGTAFSVNFVKPFYAALPQKKQNNSRQEGLLELLHLQSRLIKEGSVFPDKGNYFNDYTEAFKLLAIEKENSIRYLMSSVSDD